MAICVVIEQDLARMNHVGGCSETLRILWSLVPIWDHSLYVSPPVVQEVGMILFTLHHYDQTLGFFSASRIDHET